MNQRTKLLILQLAVVVGVCAFLFFFGLGAFGLVGADEPRYAQIAREMFNRHDWIVPTLNGQPWLEKPAFLYWKITNSYAVLGVSDWAARVPAAFHALALVLVVFFFMRRFRPGSEMDSALITASSAAVIGFARGAATDMLLASHFAIAMLAWWTWHMTGKKLWLGCFYLFMAFAVLSKGPVAPGLAALIVGAYALARRDGKIFVRSLWWPGMLLFFTVALPWYVAVQMKIPQFFRTFFIEQNLERFSTNVYHHSQPFWYYLPVFVLSTLPWTVFTVLAIVEAARNKVWQTGSEAGSEDDRRLRIFLLFWVAIPFVFFSISRSKLPGYILPTIPAAALLAADYLHRSFFAPDHKRMFTRWVVALHSLLCGLLVAAALLAPSRMLKVHPTHAQQLAIFIGTAVTVIVLYLIVSLGGLRLLHSATLFPVIVIMAFLLRPAAPLIESLNSARPVAARLQEMDVRHGPICVFNLKRELEYGLNFYQNEAIGRYERDGVPQGDHVVIAREGSEPAIQAAVGARQITALGSFPPQHLEFFSVSKQR